MKGVSEGFFWRPEPRYQRMRLAVARQVGLRGASFDRMQVVKGKLRPAPIMQRRELVSHSS